MESFKRLRAPHRHPTDGEHTNSPWRVAVTFHDGKRSNRGFPTWADAAAFMAQHGAIADPETSDAGTPRRRGRKPGMRNAPTLAACAPAPVAGSETPAEGPAFWIGLLTRTALEIASSPSDPLKRGRVLSALATAARGHQDQAELSRKVEAMEAAFTDMQTAEDYGTATSPGGAYPDAGDATQSERALS